MARTLALARESLPFDALEALRGAIVLGCAAALIGAGRMLPLIG